MGYRLGYILTINLRLVVSEPLQLFLDMDHLYLVVILRSRQKVNTGDGYRELIFTTSPEIELVLGIVLALDVVYDKNKCHCCFRLIDVPPYTRLHHISI